MLPIQSDDEVSDGCPNDSLLPSSVAAALMLAAMPEIHAEEGMWTFDNPPVKLLKAQVRLYADAGVARSSAAFQRAAERWRIGIICQRQTACCSPIITWRGDSFRRTPRPSTTIVRDGFYADTPDKEMKSPDLEVNVLVGMQDVTARVQGAAKGIADEAKALKARDAEIAAIEKESKDKTGLRSDVVSFYQGGEYWLYQYKAYTDVRLVFAPEQQAAFLWRRSG